ncbi:iron-containing alcohol dehydrogenase [Mesobacillus selenatarsenatis]|uniref:Alcohol dehydrogenase n=1 Tax=Mesobacillus selenatarsenatis (strain DSM 18680 / JCM 14380 / FERM P-15431 / SF-1) TaxID=1321606 RepID=A0A0A8X0E9_MESS1|nr:iron-containing alcohol dehydrogenase [Mesobacillus selenatarsenatis]GAM12492.1 alcohol dehydrogenase [Mesobacillus selenatarsenatis SF-1]
MIQELNLPGRIFHGAGSVEKVADAAAGLGANHLFVVISPSVLGEPLNLADRLTKIFKKTNLGMTLFSEYKGEPTTEHVRAAVNNCKESQADCIVAVGGGSAIDLAKAVSVMTINPDLQYQEIARKKIIKRLPLITVPTTAGTGSEATKVMVITEVDSGIKLNPGHPVLIPDIAILDPELALTLPNSFTAYTGMDALAHAMEAYVSTKATVLSDYFAIKAITLISKALPSAHNNGSDLEARENMLLGSCFAGIAFSNSSTNLAHAAGRALGARFNIPHGLSVALLLPYVIQYGLKVSQERYATIAKILNPDVDGSKEAMAKDVLNFVLNLNEQFQVWEAGALYLKAKLANEIPLLVEDALAGNGILTNQVIPVYKDIEQIYQKLFNKISEYSVC